jgi:N-acyl-D-amino-acid deacylase
LLAAIEEIISIARDAGMRAEISHLKTSGKKNWPMIGEALQRIRNARKSGVEITADRYPYTASCTDLDAIFPDWAAEGGRQGVLSRLRNKPERARLRQALLESCSKDYFATITIGSTVHPDNRRFQGMRLVDAAGQLGMEPVDAVLHIVEKDEVRTSAFFFGMSEENMIRILTEPYVMIGTDASLRAPGGPLGADYPHPRAYGSFARFLRMSLDGRTVPLAEAVRKMTSLPAQQFGITDRGAISKGKKADVIVFDPARVRDISDYDQPHRLSEGMETVVVNGVLTMSGGKLTGNRGGRFL